MSLNLNRIVTYRYENISVNQIVNIYKAIPNLFNQTKFIFRIHVFEMYSISL